MSDLSCKIPTTRERMSALGVIRDPRIKQTEREAELRLEQSPAGGSSRPFRCRQPTPLHPNIRAPELLDPRLTGAARGLGVI